MGKIKFSIKKLGSQLYCYKKHFPYLPETFIIAYTAATSGSIPRELRIQS